MDAERTRQDGALTGDTDIEGTARPEHASATGPLSGIERAMFFAALRRNADRRIAELGARPQADPEACCDCVMTPYQPRPR